MKMLIVLGIMAIAFTSCAIFTPQETQEERRRLLAMRDAAREQQNPERVKDAIKDLLVGKWQYVELEVEEGSVNAQRKKPVSQRVVDSLNTVVTKLPKSVPDKQATAPNAATPEKGKQNSEVNRQTPPEGATRLPPIEVTDEKSNQQILGAKAALVASTRKNLVLEFSEDRSSYYYSGSNRGTNATGQCYITTKRYGDDSLPFIRFNRADGTRVARIPVRCRTRKNR